MIVHTEALISFIQSQVGMPIYLLDSEASSELRADGRPRRLTLFVRWPFYDHVKGNHLCHHVLVLFQGSLVRDVLVNSLLMTDGQVRGQ